MGHSYYYFVASLPFLSWDTRLSMTFEDFIRLSKEHLAPADIMLLEKSLRGQEAAYFLTLKRLRDFENAFKNELVWHRASRQGKDPRAIVRGGRDLDIATREAVEEALKTDDPLVAERILDARLCTFLDEIGTGHYFDLDTLLIYGAKLKILERWAVIRSSRGEELLKELVTSVQGTRVPLEVVSS